ncbi:MAG: hypothetical protein PHG85_01040 [Candidatus Altiarchaeota archaeon]|nr:hypothetical protein [Candidatus Altiarchaeota archaeon]
MSTTTVQPGGGMEGRKPPGPGLPPSIQLKEVIHHGEHFQVYEGAGRSGDITTIGCRSDLLRAGDHLAIYVGQGHRVISRAKSEEGSGIGASGLVARYLLQKGVLGEGTLIAASAKIRPERVRVSIVREGLHDVFILDMQHGDAKEEKITSVLADININRNRIRLDSNQFKPK